MHMNRRYKNFYQAELKTKRGGKDREVLKGKGGGGIFQEIKD